MTALMPDTDACSTGRPVSAARICLSARCCSLLADRWYERLLVLTTTISAPSRTKSRTSGPNADSKQITLPNGCPPTRNSVRASPGSKSYGHLAQLGEEAERVAPRHVLAERHEVLLRVRCPAASRRACTAGWCCGSRRRRRRVRAFTSTSASCSAASSVMRCAQVRVDLGVGVERRLREHDEVVVALELLGEREVLLGEELVDLLGQRQLLVVALEHRDPERRRWSWARTG